MSIVAAGVHALLGLRSIFEGVFLNDLIAIHVGPQTDHRTFSVFQNADNTCFSNVFRHFITEFSQLFRHDLRRSYLFERRFRMLMEIVSPGDNFLFQLFFIKHNHSPLMIHLQRQEPVFISEEIANARAQRAEC